jgi:hypothetical protein
MELDYYCNFHDEREWRFIPQSSEGEKIPLVINKNNSIPGKENEYNNLIESNNSYCIKIPYNKIKYIIVANQKDRRNLMNYILNGEVKANNNEKLKLISKIMVFRQIREDW